MERVPDNLTISISLTQLSGSASNTTINEPISTSTAGTTRFMRFIDDQFINNLTTKPLPEHSALYKITLTIMQTGQTTTVNLGLKPNGREAKTHLPASNKDS